jgi:hypothetical protein
MSVIEHNGMERIKIINIISELLSTGPEITLHITTDRMMQLVMYLQTVYETWWTPGGKHTYLSRFSRTTE